MKKQLPFRLILASASPARPELLEAAGYQFDIIPANIDEPTESGPRDPRALVEHIAWLKASEIARRLANPASVARPESAKGVIHPQPRPSRTQGVPHTVI